MWPSDLAVLGEPARNATCSRAGCLAAASWNVNWRNPRIHGPERVKVWLACDDHRDWLRDYLASRDFPVEVTPFGVAVLELEVP